MRPTQRGLRAAGLALLAAALLSRLLFWRATPDAAWAWSALYKGDAPLWLEYAQAVQAGRPFELGLPIHPPATAWLVAGLWNGDASGIAVLRASWAALGALAVGLAALAALRSFGPVVAAVAGALCCFSTGLLVLSGSVDSETPYLVLVLAALALFEDVRGRPRARVLVPWAVLNAVACLFRVEHALYFALVLGLLALLWRRGPGGAPGSARAVGLALGCFLLTLAPWHVAAWRAVARFNTEEPRRGRAEEAALRSVEQALRGIEWDPEARARCQALPAFARRTACGFVAATVAWRGSTRVRPEDVGILHEAFGSVPTALQPFPFLSAYGPLNFALAQDPTAGGGFSRNLLDLPPLLAGGAERYPPPLVAGLPPPRLSFDYPPHVQLFNDGYAVGWQRIAADPRGAAALALRKLRLFWDGASLGLSGYDMPLGQSGVRRAVDLTVPDPGAATTTWRGIVALVCLAGVAAGWRRPALHAWLLFALSKAVVAAAFFGYARLGATVVPVVAVLAATAADHWLRPLAQPLASPRFAARAFAAVLLVGVAVEAARWAQPPVLRLDGLAVGEVDPFPADLHRDQRIDVAGAAR